MPCNIELYKDGGVLITSFCLEALYLIGQLPNFYMAYRKRKKWALKLWFYKV